MVSTNQGLGYNQYITTTIDRINGDDVYLTPIETDFEVNWRIPFSKETLIYEGNSPESIVVKPFDPRTWTKDEVKTLFTRYNEFISHNDPEHWDEWIEKNIEKH